jgi:hypothetical protein
MAEWTVVMMASNSVVYSVAHSVESWAVRRADMRAVNLVLPTVVHWVLHWVVTTAGLLVVSKAALKVAHLVALTELLSAAASAGHLVAS